MMLLFRRIATPPQVLSKRVTFEDLAARHGVRIENVVNVGSKNVRVCDSCLNVDIVPGREVDVVGDAHHLSDLVGEEMCDVVVLSAVLQYCANPGQVIAEASRVLRPGGWMFIDAPFLQPYCVDGADLWRFTADGLRLLCEPHVEVVEIETSIATGPALAFAAQATATTGGRNRYLTALWVWVVSIVVLPLRFAPHANHRTAGAFLLAARKPARDLKALAAE
jgi:SAM-dependent methyltransferase